MRSFRWTKKIQTFTSYWELVGDFIYYISLGLGDVTNVNFPLMSTGKLFGCWQSLNIDWYIYGL